MPRVSDQHLAARRRQIVEAATRCFNRSGFHGTSVQDVIGEAGLSVGAFYRYFRSKDDLVRAIAQEKIDEVSRVVDEALAATPQPPLLTTLDKVLAVVDRSMGPDGPLRIAVQVWGEAQRDPELAAMVADIYGRIRDKAALLVDRAQADGQVAPGADPRDVGTVLFGLIQGYLMQRLLIGDLDRAEYVAGLRALLVPGR